MTVYLAEYPSEHWNMKGLTMFIKQIISSVQEERYYGKTIDWRTVHYYYSHQRDTVSIDCEYKEDEVAQQIRDYSDRMNIITFLYEDFSWERREHILQRLVKMVVWNNGTGYYFDAESLNMQPRGLVTHLSANLMTKKQVFEMYGPLYV